MTDPETWLGNIQRAVEQCPRCDDAHTYGVCPSYCLRCGSVHGPGECLRGDR